MKQISIYFEKKHEDTVLALAELAEQVENQTGEKIDTGTFDSFADFLNYYSHHYRPLLKQVRDGFTPTGDDARLLRFLATDLLEMFGEDEDDTEDAESKGNDEDPTLTEQEKRETLYRLWNAAWHEARQDPEGTRVIVETNEQDPSAPANEFGRYYMIDGSEAESCIDHAGQWVVIRVDIVKSPYEVRRPNWHHLNGYADSETQLMCKCENPNNVTRWARLMIDAGRVTDIYADSY